VLWKKWRVGQVLMGGFGGKKGRGGEGGDPALQESLEMAVVSGVLEASILESDLGDFTWYNWVGR